MSYPVYEEMQDSGVEWLKDTPRHWNVQRLKFSCQINPPKSEVVLLSSQLSVSFLPMEKVGTEGELELDTTRPLESVLQGFTYFRNGDVIVAKITPCFENGKGALCRNLVNNIGFGSTEFHVLRSQSGYWQKFIYYITRSHPFRSIGTALMQGSAGQKRVQDEFIQDFTIAWPPLAEQQRIAAFLDTKTAEIDELIALKEQQVALLQRKRMALISRAVTKGLDPHTPMRDSGIDWLGEVPEEWKSICLKYLAHIKYGLGQPPAQLDGGLPLLRATNIYRGNITTDDLMLVDPDEVPHTRDPILRTNDIIVVRSGVYTGDSAIISPEYDGAVAGYDMVVRVKKANARYVAYSLLSIPLLENQINVFRMRAAQPHLNAEELGNCILFIPSHKIQNEIVDYLDHETAHIDSLVATIQEQVAKLRTYRQALITAAVTGKIDVRSVDISDPVEE